MQLKLINKKIYKKKICIEKIKIISQWFIFFDFLFNGSDILWKYKCIFIIVQFLFIYLFLNVI